jgi:putative tricarboxylic transport membrane protein
MDVVIMGVFGGVGYLMRKWEYEPAPLVLAFVLGERLESAVRQTLIYSRGDFSIFVRRPVAAAFLTIALLLILSSLFSGVIRRKPQGKINTA